MSKKPVLTKKQLLAEHADLRARLEEAEETLRAIHCGEVDALVVTTDQGEQIFSLKGAEHSYRVLVEQMGEGAVTLSVEGMIVYCNQRFAEMVSAPIEQVIGRDFRAFISPTNRATLEAALEAKTSACQDKECELSTTAGISMPARLTLVYLPLETPPVFGLTAADLSEVRHREMELQQARDHLEERVVERTAELQREIAERKQVEEKLRGSEDRYRTLAEAAHDMIFIINQDGFIEYVNAFAVSQFGLHPEEVIGKRGQDLFPPEMAEFQQANAQTVFQTLEPLYVEGKESFSGGAVWLGTWLVPLKNEHGAVRSVFGISRDITARKQAEEALWAESKFNRLIIENAGVGICVCHEIQEFPYVRFTVWNERMKLITGYSIEEINQLGWYQSMYPDPQVQERAIRRMQSMRVGDDIQSEEWEITRIDKEKRQLIITTSLYQLSEDVIHVLGVMHDITERIQMEEKLKELSATDALTGLYNRRFFEDEMALLERGRRFPVSIVMADLNGLKKVNDHDGHAAGDALLQRAAQALNAAFRAEDVIARIGGDEFAVLLHSTDAASAGQLLIRVRSALDRHNAARDGMPLSIAFGISTAEQGDTLTDTLKEADARMYAEKRGS